MPIRLEGTERTKLSARVNNSNANINAAEIVIKLCLDALTVKTILVYVYCEAMWAVGVINACGWAWIYVRFRPRMF
jgi:hypothetical protein